MDRFVLRRDGGRASPPPKRAALTARPSGQVPCPMCGARLSPGAIEIHAQLCEGPVRLNSSRPPTAGAGEEEKEKEEGVDVDVDVPGSSSSAPSALDALMAAARKPVERLTGAWTPEQRLATTWTSPAPPTWKARMQVGRKGGGVSVDVAWNGTTETGGTFHVDRTSQLTVGVLKSVMQKAFRRRDVDTVRSAANELASKAWTEFVRRAPVVIVEDGILHPDLDVLCFLLLADAAASPSPFVPSPAMVEFAVRIMCEAASSPVQDGGGGAEETGLQGAADLSLALLHTRPEASLLAGTKALGLVKALLIRAEFGGMQGDVVMLRNFAATWLARFASSETQWMTVIAQASPRLPPFAPPHLGLLARDQVPRSAVVAIDCHVQPRLFDDLVATSFGGRRDAFESLMWRLRAGLNFRASAADDEALVDLVTRGGSALEDEARRARAKAEAIDAGLSVSQKHDDVDVWNRVLLREVNEICMAFLRSRLLAGRVP